MTTMLISFGVVLMLVAAVALWSSLHGDPQAVTGVIGAGVTGIVCVSCGLLSR